MDAQSLLTANEEEWKEKAVEVLGWIKECLAAEDFSTTNLSLDNQQVLQMALILEALCSTISSLVRTEQFGQSGGWSVLVRALEASRPKEELQKFRPKLSADAMGKLFAAAQSGEQIRPSDLQAEPEEPSEGLLLMNHWLRVRRAVFGILRNAVRFPEGKEIKRHIASNRHLLRCLGRSCAEVLEEGVNISYACTILRFLLPPPDEVPVMVEDWYRNVAEVCLEEDVIAFVIGNAVTSRVVTLPDGTRLWVHMEATRLVAALISVAETSELPSLLLSTRALCDAILATHHLSMHMEMARALLRLIEQCPSTPVPPNLPGPTYQPTQWMVEMNERRMVDGTLALIAIGSREYFANPDNDAAVQSILLSLRLARWVGELRPNLILDKCEDLFGVLEEKFPDAGDVKSFLEAHCPEADDSSQHPAAKSSWLSWMCPLL